ncbi:hypothetical protein ACHAWF_004615 [Thalassiosira exigua]
MPGAGGGGGMPGYGGPQGRPDPARLDPSIGGSRCDSSLDSRRFLERNRTRREARVLRLRPQEKRDRRASSSSSAGRSVDLPTTWPGDGEGRRRESKKGARSSTRPDIFLSADARNAFSSFRVPPPTNRKSHPTQYATPPPGRNSLAMQTGGQWTMASNRGPHAVTGHHPPTSGPPPPAAPSTTSPSHAARAAETSEYYKARNAQGGPAFSWAAVGGGGGGGVGGVGGGAAGPAPAAAPPVPSGVGGSWASAPSGPPPPPPPAGVAARSHPPPVGAPIAAPAAGGGGGVASPAMGGGGGGGGGYERDLVADLCPPGGMRAEPPPDRLADFVRAVPSLDPDLVCPALLDALEEGNPWIMRAKALCVIEAVLDVEQRRSDGGEGDPARRAYEDFFHACAGEIVPLAGHARGSVRGPAGRVLAKLGVDPNGGGGGGGGGGGDLHGGGASADVAGGGAAAAAKAPPADLLDFDVPAPAAPAPVPIQEAATVPQAMTVGGGGGGGSLFSGLSTKAVDGMDGAAVGGGGTGAALATPPTAPVVLNGGGLVADPFGTAEVHGGAEATAAASTGATSAAPPAAGSAFGFMNAAPPASPLPSPVHATPASPPAKTFDPLLGLGGSVPPPPVAPGGAPVSPVPNGSGAAQMQQMQMAYQQNVMMMQRQMQQMQMQMAGYPVQGGVGGGVGAGATTAGATGGGAKPPVMGANYMRQVPVAAMMGDGTTSSSSFSFLGSDPRKRETKSFDFVKDAMQSEKK